MSKPEAPSSEEPSYVATDRHIATFIEDLKEHGCPTCTHTAEKIIARLRHAEFAAQMNAETIANMRKASR